MAEYPNFLTSIPRELAAVTDYETHARQFMTPNTAAYVYGGAGDEITMRWNREAFDRLRIIPRVLRGGGQSTKITLLGRAWAHPIFVAPVAYQKLAHPDGEIATARAADAIEAGMILSTVSSHTLEDVAAAGSTCRWFQIYFQQDRELTFSLAERAEQAGYEAIVVTVDAPVLGARNREVRAGFHIPAGIDAANWRGLQNASYPPVGQAADIQGLMSHAVTWDDIKRLKERCNLPVIIKGVLSPEDAQLAIDMGLAGIVVSNHGGRTLDTLPSTIGALPQIAQRVAGKIPVLLDGGIRRGTDVLKAIALGANAVLIGRPVMYGLGLAGALGVAHVLKLLREELEIAMALTGCKSLSDATPELISNS